MPSWLAVTGNEIEFEDVGGAEMNNGVVRYVSQRRDDGSFGAVIVDGRRIQPLSAMVYMQGNTLHIQVG